MFRSKSIKALSLAAAVALVYVAPSFCESESGGFVYGGGDSESGGVQLWGDSDSGGVLWGRSESGGVRNSGAESDSGGMSAVGSHSESGGPTDTGAETDSPAIRVRNY